MQVLQLSRELTIYTIKICKNEKVFPKSYRWILTQQIVNEAVEAMNCIRRANSTRLPDGKMQKDVASDNARYRLRQQSEAYSHLEALLGMMDIAYGALPISGDRMEYWTGLVVGVEEKLKAWVKSDKKRVSDAHKS